MWSGRPKERGSYWTGVISKWKVLFNNSSQKYLILNLESLNKGQDPARRPGKDSLVCLFFTHLLVFVGWNHIVLLSLCRTQMSQLKTQRTVWAPWPVCVKWCWKHRESRHVLEHIITATCLSMNQIVCVCACMCMQGVSQSFHQWRDRVILPPCDGWSHHPLWPCSSSWSLC